MKSVQAAGRASGISEPAMLTAQNTTKPGCQRKCGELTIPYPFGIGLSCSQDTYFSIVCNTSFNPPRAFSMVGLGSKENPDILQITETQLMIRNLEIASKCYNSKGNVISENEFSFDIFASPFTFSSTANKLTTVGCDDYALIHHSDGTQSQWNTVFNFRTGCLALCFDPEKVIRGYCSGLGCCEASIPLGLQSFTLSMESLNNHTTQVLSAQYCGYGFLVGNGNFSFAGTSDLTTGKVAERVANQGPLVLDWAVGLFEYATSVSCNKAKKKASTYVCQSNSECVDSDAGGYNCNCRSGYEGNPYLFPGCTDINECAADLDSPCSMTCVNTPGSYICTCPDGFYGDGQKYGIACLKIVHTSSFKKIALGLG